MRLITRKKGSQRKSKPIPLHVHPNFGGQNGDQRLIFETADTYFIIEPDDMEDGRKILSAVSAMFHNQRQSDRNAKLVSAALATRDSK